MKPGNFHLFADLPVGCSGNGDFITGGGSRTVEVRTPGGGVEVRKERWVVSDRMLQYGDPPPPPGRIALSESTVTEMAGLLDMVPRSEVHRLAAELSRVGRELEDLSDTLARVLRENEDLRIASDTRTVFVAPDGTEHASRVALERHMAVLS